ncbi:Exodeoxyribonuclease VII large subunit [hydrothermal vent metagenome]|uniref:Exodeoxyribonuclease VII large subunit n=1 Tax=hydrothermal vent metagenome TaxID=652676 RepID=A0A3B0TDK7_9ZZZZ
MPKATTQDSNTVELTVSELSGAIKRTVEDAFGYVRLRGEVSGYRGPHSSGHCYFALKDEKAKIDAIIWRGVFQRLSIKPEEGLEVIATGKVTTYPGRSSYQIVIDRLEPAGEGALLALLKARERKLAAEGLFDPAAKRKLPALPRVIGVVTSPTGAVIRDILHRLADRFPSHVLVWPVRVQGEGSGDEVAMAIGGFNGLAPGGTPPRPDLIIVARGGGSLEDLWGFNDEAVVRAAAASTIALISAVGHQTDVTLIDHAADVRAPTPTAAAELAVPVRRELIVRVEELAARRGRAMARLVAEARARLDAAAGGLPRRAELFAIPRQRLDAATSGLAQGLAASLHRHRERFTRASAQGSPAHLKGQIGIRRGVVAGMAGRAAAAARQRLARLDGRLGAIAGRLSSRPLVQRNTAERRRLAELDRRMKAALARDLADRAGHIKTLGQLFSSLGHKAVLARGYALVRDAKGGLIRTAAAARKAADILVTLADGDVNAKVIGAMPLTRSAVEKKPDGKGGKGGDGNQGTLF